MFISYFYPSTVQIFLYLLRVFQDFYAANEEYGYAPNLAGILCEHEETFCMTCVF